MKVCSLLICKEQVWFPNRVQHGRIQVQRVVRILLVRQPRVIPLLSQENVESIILKYRGLTHYEKYCPVFGAVTMYVCLKILK